LGPQQYTRRGEKVKQNIGVSGALLDKKIQAIGGMDPRYVIKLFIINVL
jgi:hypothetical protein